MDKSFYFIDDTKETSKPIDLKATKIIVRSSLIRAICEDKDNGYLTEYNHIVKLCRLCMNDIYKELKEKANNETIYYKKYKDMYDKIKEGENLPVDDKEQFIKEIREGINTSNMKYNNYCNKLLKFKKVKLYTKNCYICSELKNIYI